jgi:hypothetical protein
MIYGHHEIYWMRVGAGEACCSCKRAACDVLPLRISPNSKILLLSEGDRLGLEFPNPPSSNRLPIH